MAIKPDIYLAAYRGIKLRLRVVAIVGMLLLTVASVTALSMTSFARDEKPNAYSGHYGELILLPSNYVVSSKFVDPEQSVEVAVFYPQGTPAAAIEETFLDQSSNSVRKRYNELGIMRFLAIPRNHSSFGDTPGNLDINRAGVSVEWQNRGARVLVRDIELTRPTLEISITGSVEMCQIIIEGKELIYIFTGGQKNKVTLHRMAASFRELPTSKD